MIYGSAYEYEMGKALSRRHAEWQLFTVEGTAKKADENAIDARVGRTANEGWSKLATRCTIVSRAQGVDPILGKPRLLRAATSG